MLYLIIAIFVAVGMGLVYNAGREQGVNSYKVQEAAAQAKIEQQAKQLHQEAENKIIDMQAAFTAGEANAQVVTKTVYVKGQAYVASNAVFSNPACVVPADGVLILNSARAGVRSAADPAGTVAALSDAGVAAGRQTGNAVPATDTGHGTVGAVHTDAGTASGGGQVPAGSVRPVAKPKPK
jgi:hypothetical protein